MTDEQVRQLVARLNGRSQTDAFEAAKAIWDDSDNRLERPVILILREGRKPFNRTAAAYAMQMLTTPKTIIALERVVKNKSEHPRVRGQAAESLAHHHRKKSHDVLLRGLADPDKDVRFWSAYALGEMAEKRAVPALKLLVSSDTRTIRGFHSVGKEAADTIKCIAENAALRRKNGCVFCIRG
jgi:HEAT repeat protein